MDLMLKGELHPLYLAARVDASWSFRPQGSLLSPKDDERRRKIFEALLFTPDIKLEHSSLPNVSLLYCLWIMYCTVYSLCTVLCIYYEG